MIEIENLKKEYHTGKRVVVHALNGVNTKIQDGESVAIVGPSGSGKSTILNILGGLDREYTGTIRIDDKDIRKYNTNYYRRNIVGTIFQQFYLIPSLNVVENILLPISLGRQMNKQETCLLYTSPSPRDRQKSRMPSSA